MLSKGVVMLQGAASPRAVLAAEKQFFRELNGELGIRLIREQTVQIASHIATNDSFPFSVTDPVGFVLQVHLDIILISFWILQFVCMESLQNKIKHI